MGRQSRTQAIMLTKDIQIGPDSSGHALQIALTDFGRMPLLQTSQPHLTPSCKSRRSLVRGGCQKLHPSSISLTPAGQIEIHTVAGQAELVYLTPPQVGRVVLGASIQPFDQLILYSTHRAKQLVHPDQRMQKSRTATTPKTMIVQPRKSRVKTAVFLCRAW